MKRTVSSIYIYKAERGRVVVKALSYYPEGHGFETRWDEGIPAGLAPGVYSASNRNEYQKQRNNVSGSRARPMRRADNLTAICEPIV
jgi:hypothetical protein